MRPSGQRKLLPAAGILLGAGLGGFVDGILLHQILQWHNMLSSVHPPTTMRNMELNMYADGLFHAFVWLATALGLSLLWVAARAGEAQHTTTRSFVGLLIIGAGLFNLIEGLIDHQLLGIHHVREGPDWLAWDLAFLAFGGVALVVLGSVLLRGGRQHTGA
jgi:uncharacterized membrane protein